jgi:hypothetical protein
VRILPLRRPSKGNGDTDSNSSRTATDAGSGGDASNGAGNRDDDFQDPQSLPARWGVILVAGIGTGVALGFAAGPLAGVMAGVAVAGLLHKILN